MTETMTNGFDTAATPKNGLKKKPSNGSTEKRKRKAKLPVSEETDSDESIKTPSIIKSPKKERSAKTELIEIPAKLPNKQRLKAMETPETDPKRVKVIPQEQQKPSSSLVNQSEEVSSFVAMRQKAKEMCTALPEDMPMEERLKTITDEQTRKRTRRNTTGDVMDSLVMLLTQALHSRDDSNLEKVFAQKNKKKIHSTVSQLPVQLVLPLLQTLQSRMRSKPQSRQYLPWLQETLSTHTSYLSSSFETRQELFQIREFMENRTGFIEKLARLRGKLQTIKNQLEQRKSANVVGNQVPLLVFEEESSEGESEEDEKDDGATSDEQTDGDLELDWWEEQRKTDESDSGDSSDEEEQDTGSEGGEDDSDVERVLGKKVAGGRRRRRNSDEEEEGLGDSDDDDADLEEKFGEEEMESEDDED